GDHVAAHDATEDVDEDGLEVGVAQHDLEGLGDLLGGRAAADIEEVRGFATEQLDGVHGGHRQARAIDEAADVAIELDVGEVELRRLDLGRVFLVDVAHRDDVGMAVERVVIEIELGIERNDGAITGEDQGIDLG